jgi:hypothetical protein
MLIDIAATAIVTLLLAAVTHLIAKRFPLELRQLIWLALLEWLVSVAVQSIYSRIVVGGGDMLTYFNGGVRLNRWLDQSFSLAGPELFKLLIQRPSAFDRDVFGAGDNTGSMFAMTAFLLFFLGGAQHAVQVVVAGFSFFGALQIYAAFKDAEPGLNSRRLFFATVLFPSISFWTAALHKESFCLIGMGCLLTAWRGFYRRRFLRILLMGPLGLGLILIFRAPALPPLAVGLAVYIVWERIRSSRGGEAVFIGPFYMIVGLGLLLAGLLLVSRVAPTLGIDRIADTMSGKQARWQIMAGRIGGAGESAIGDDEDPPALTAGEQVARVPFALVNALFRPQIFDIHSLGTLVSAAEMTTVSYLLLRSIYRRGVGGLLTDVQRSPLLVMCLLVTFVGCAFIGLVTYNLGTLARYRVPFLPFYGTLISILAERATKKAQAPATRRDAASVARSGSIAPDVGRALRK